jgi:hypothetical protein
VRTMGTRRSGAGIRIVCVAMAIAVAATIGGCGGSASTQEGTSGTATSLVAPAPGVRAGGAPNQSTATNAYSAAASDANKGGGTTVAAPVQKLVVVNKTLRIEATDVDATIAKIRALAAGAGGDITNMQVSTAIDQPVSPVPLDGTVSPDGSVSSGGSSSSSTPLRAYVTVRVPSKTYAAFVADTVKLGRVLFQSETSDDVTQQHVDMQARLGNLQAEQARLRQLFARAKNVSDMLAIEQELTRVQGDIESLQAQITYLEGQAAMATVTIELTEPQAIVSPAGIDWGTKSALTTAVRAFVDTMNMLIVLLGPALALLVFVGVPVLVVVLIVRRALRRRAARTPSAPASAPIAPPSSPQAGAAPGLGTGA